jgi:hypothetical protein
MIYNSKEATYKTKKRLFMILVMIASLTIPVSAYANEVPVELPTARAYDNEVSAELLEIEAAPARMIHRLEIKNHTVTFNGNPPNTYFYSFWHAGFGCTLSGNLTLQRAERIGSTNTWVGYYNGWVQGGVI